VPIEGEANQDDVIELSSLTDKQLDRFRLFLSIVRNMDYDLNPEIQKVSKQINAVNTWHHF